jgi:hypothetical protein
MSISTDGKPELSQAIPKMNMKLPYPPPEYIYIYGAGRYGVFVAMELERRGIKTKAFIDISADGTKTLLGLPVLYPNTQNLKPYIIIAIKNKIAVKEITKNLKSHGIGKKDYYVFTFDSFFERVLDTLVLPAKHLYTYLLYILFKKKKFKYKLSIAAIAKNEGVYIKEWIEYHVLVGVEHFYIYDNESDDNTLEVLKPYINSGLVEYKFIKNNFVKKDMRESPGMLKPQLPAFRDAVRKSKFKTKWLALIDIDEFIVPISKEKIDGILDDIENIINKPFVALGIHWVNYTYNGHKTKPDGLIIENYTKSCGVNKIIKSIVNPRSVITICNPHYAKHFFGLHGVNENGKQIKNPPGCNEYVTEQDAKKLRINHYVTKSYEEHKQKYERNIRGNLVSYTMIPPLPPFEHIEENCTEDFVMEKYVKTLKERVRA